MAEADRILASLIDPDGHEVVLLARIWSEKIALDHPELADHRDAIVETVSRPEHVEADQLPGRRRFYRRNVGPSRSLLALAVRFSGPRVSYEVCTSLTS